MTNNVEVKVTRLYKMEKEGPVKAFCDINVDDSILIKGLKVVEGEKGTFVGLPSEAGRDGRWYTTVFLLNQALKEKVDEAVLAAYNT